MYTTRWARRGMQREWRLHVLSVFSLAVAFVCLGAALLVLVNLRALEIRWAHAGRASVYLKDGVGSEEVEAVRTALLKVPGVTAARYLPSGEARAEFGAREAVAGGELAALPVEAFPASIELEIRPDMSDEDLASMVEKLEKLPAVDDVETYQTWTERLTGLVRAAVAAAALLTIVVLVAVLAVVGSTIRLALRRRSAEVEVLRLVGATDDFVRAPFVMEGSVQGGLGAAGAIALLGALFAIVRARLDGELTALVGLEPQFLPWTVALGMVVLGAGLGATAALVSLRRVEA